VQLQFKLPVRQEFRQYSKG